MGVRDIVMSRVVAPAIKKAAPDKAAGLMRAAFGKAVDGVGPLKGAAEDADRRLQKAHGDVERAIDDVIGDHVRMAAAEGFVTNIGGLASMAVLVPTNIAGIALIQCRMVAEIAHLRGYDLADPHVRTAVFATMLGAKAVRALEKDKQLPSRPRAIATGPALDQATTDRISAAVTGEIIARAAGRSTVTMIGKRVPVLGGVVGGATDSWTTRQIGKYAARELTQRVIQS
ncbi:EcsC family protein [Cumulibacter manganitolerans]|uniref:EcsC family protein n=1 Tax=Cumulibacter manganitolerans TaxID=1884992 RepID=UPI001E417EA0|nr:EcsC family protein [Cumulibacter manganitolerans]